MTTSLLRAHTKVLNIFLVGICVLRQLFLNGGRQVFGNLQGIHRDINGSNTSRFLARGTMGANTFLDGNVVGVLREKVGLANEMQE